MSILTTRAGRATAPKPSTPRHPVTEPIGTARRKRRHGLNAQLVVGAALIALIALMALVSLFWTPYRSEEPKSPTSVTRLR